MMNVSKKRQLCKTCGKVFLTNAGGWRKKGPRVTCSKACATEYERTTHHRKAVSACGTMKARSQQSEVPR
jgi:hypothetical protein